MTDLKVKDVRAKGFTHVSQKNDVFTVRVGFFYKMGKSTEDLVKRIKDAFPNAEIVDSGEHYTSFRGGASLSQQSHWFVKFKFPQTVAQASQ